MKIEKSIEHGGAAEPGETSVLTGFSKTILVAGGFVLFLLAVAMPAVVDLSATEGAVAGSVVLAAILAMLSAFDTRFYCLPDAMTLPLGALGLLFCHYFRWDVVGYRIAAMVVGFMALYLIGAGYQHLRGRAGIGLGDAKLLASGGAWLGFEGLPAALLIACLAALMSVAVMAARGHMISATTRLPFGPFIAVGIWVVWVYGPILG